MHERIPTSRKVWVFLCCAKKKFCKKKVFSLNCCWALSLRSRSSREGFSFLLPEQKKRNKENSPSALFGLLRSGIPLKKKNSLRSNSFFFFTLHPSPFASRPKSEAGPLCFFYATSLRSLGCDVFFFSLRSLFCHPERSKA